MKFSYRYQVILILFFAVFAYANSFNVSFQFDDVPNIYNNEQIKDISNIFSIFVSPKWPFGSRPLMHATIALNYHFGGLDTWGYHVVNLAIHLINGILLYLLVLMTGKHLNYEEKAVRTASLLASALFLLHPMQTDAVTYIVSRSMLLATAFYFIGMILFLKAVTVKKGRSFYIGGLFVASLFGMGSRENFATFPVMLVLYDLFFVSKFRLREAVGRWKIYLPVFFSLGYLAFLVINNTYARSVDYPGVGVSAENYFLTEFSVHWTYLRLLVLPIGQNVDYDYPIANSLLEFPTILSFIGYLGLWAVVIVLARRRPVVSFSVLWFLVALLPISFGVTLMNLRLDDVIFEHRLYLPGAGILVLASALLTGIATRRRVLLPALAVGVLLLGGLAYERNSLWSDGIGLWQDSVKKSPRKARPYLNLGFAYWSAGLSDNAEEQYLLALKFEPQYFEAHFNLGEIYSRTSENEKAIKHLQTAIELDPYDPQLHNILGNVYSKIGEDEKAIKQFRFAIALDPNYAEAHNNLGIIYHKSPELRKKAILHFKRAVMLNPGLADAHFNLGMSYLEEGLLDMARERFETVLKIDPQYPMAMQFLEHISETEKTERSE